MYLLVRLFSAFWGAKQRIFSFCPLRFVFCLHLVVVVVGYAKPCWRDGDARISNADVCQYGRNDYCCCYVFNEVKCSCCDMRRKYGLNINMPGTNISYSIPDILFLTLKRSTILSHIPTLKFCQDGELYNLHSHSSRRPGLFIDTSKHLHVLP